jgi:HK97 family phage portal protein
MGKGKGKRAKREQALALRHGFDPGGLLGHESTYSVNVTESVSMMVDVVFACVRLLQSAVGDAQIGEYRGNSRLPDSRLTRRPMASITRRSWVKRCVGSMALYNGVWLLRSTVRDSEGVPMSLVPYAPTRVQWESEDKVRVDAQEVSPDRLVWVPRMEFPTLTRDLAYTIRLAREAIAAGWSADAARSDYWEKGGMLSWYVKSDQALSGDDAAAIKAKVAEARANAPGEPMVFGKGSDIKSLGIDLSQHGVSEAQAKTAAAIARYFGVHAYLVNVPSEAGNLVYQNASAAGLDLVRFTLQPEYAGPLGDALTDELPGNAVDGRRVVFDLRHLTRGTNLEEAQTYQIATGNKAWMLPSEVRNELHMPLDMTLDEAGTPAPALERIEANG